MRGPVKWYGGKQNLAKRIVPLFPAHTTYVEPFGGGAAVLLTKPPSTIEVYNDLNERITRLFRVIRDNGIDLQQKLQATPYSEAEFDYCGIADCCTDEVELARRDYVRFRMSFAGKGNHFSFSVAQIRRGVAGCISNWLSAIDDDLPAITERLRTVQIMRRDAVQIIERFDSADTIHYCDPPYLASSRVSPEVYEHEMTDADHERLLRTLTGCRGWVVVSGYDNDLYHDYLGKWYIIDNDMPNNGAGTNEKGRVNDMLWCNFVPDNLDAF